MYVYNRLNQLVRALASPRLAVLITLASLSAACSDSPSRLNGPSFDGTSAAASQFAVLANAALSCTDGNITRDVGTFLATPTGSVTQTGCPISGTVHVGDDVAQQAYNEFLSTYAALAPKPGDVCTTLTGTLGGVTLSPGVYCFDAAASLTGVLTLNGPSDGIWTFKIGTSGTGALTGTSFSMVMAGGGQPGNVTWWVAEAATLTDSDFIGTILGGAAITLTRGTFNGNAWAKADVTITGTAVTGSERQQEPATPELATITVMPNPVTLAINATQQFTALGTDANGNTVAITATWSVVAGGGIIDATGSFTAGTVDGTFVNTVQATSGNISGATTVVVNAPPPPAPSDFAVLANAAVSCTDGNISSDVGTFLATPTGSVTQTGCPISGTVHVGDDVARQAFNEFLSTYAAVAPKLGDVCTTLAGTLAGVTLSPGVYCFDAAATLTGVLTLNGPSDGIWTFKIGTSGTGALTGTSFSVVMAGSGQPGNVTWWVAEAATMTDSHLIGTILGGAAITLTRGTFNGNLRAKGDVTITGTAVRS